MRSILPESFPNECELFIMRPASLPLSFLFATSAALLAGCALPANDPNSRSIFASPKHEREKMFLTMWKGIPYDVLVEAYGVPPVSMEIPGRADEVTFAVVYGKDGASRCIDAFTIIIDRASKERRVAGYFCR